MQNIPRLLLLTIAANLLLMLQACGSFPPPEEPPRIQAVIFDVADMSTGHSRVSTIQNNLRHPSDIDAVITKWGGLAEEISRPQFDEKAL